MAHFKAYLFDLDGTLIDTVKTFQTMLSDLGWLKRPFDDTETFLCGVDSRALLDYIFGKDVGDINPMHHQLIAHYDKHMPEVTFFYPHARELLKNLKDSGHKVGIVSNKNHNLCQTLNKHFRLDVDLFLGSGIVGIKKPHPAPLIYACRELAVLPQHSFYLGDMPSDLEAARYCLMPAGFARYGGYIAFDKNFHYHREIDSLIEFYDMVLPGQSSKNKCL